MVGQLVLVLWAGASHEEQHTLELLCYNVLYTAASLMPFRNARDISGGRDPRVGRNLAAARAQEQR